jgi:riboflavin kinase/FMN adenylyltransferase
MLIYEKYTELPEEIHDAVLVIGNFDGVHLAHQQIIKTASSIARKSEKKLAILTFEPHPRRVFRPDDPPFRITPPELKQERLKECGVDILFQINFDWAFASLSAEEFVNRVLISGIKPAHIVVGHDFCFGQLRKGNTDTLKKHGFEVTILEQINLSENRISSSAIRSALRHGEIGTANTLLGWNWEMRGKIVEGDKRGRQLGFPTANVPLLETLHPDYGVYAAKVKIMEDGENAPWLNSATNIGIRPMFELAMGQIESHILEFDRDIYGYTLCVRPVKKLRGEAKFDSIEQLIEQMDKDCQQARAVLEQYD